MSGPVVGIVVPAFNAARYLSATLRSVRSQLHRELLCCIVDDGSTDETAAIAAHLCYLDDRFSLICTPNNGQSAANNRGFAELADRIDYVCFLDSDDVLRPDALTRLVAAAEADPTLVGAHGLAVRIDAAGRLLDDLQFDDFGRGREGFGAQGLHVLDTDRPTTFQTLAINDRMIPPSVAIVRAAILAKTGGYDPGLALWPDWDLFLRLARQGDFGFVDQVTVDYRLHDTNLSSSPGLGAASKVVRIRAFDSPENTPAQRSACALGWRIVESRIAHTHWLDCRQAIARGAWSTAVREAAKVAVARARQAAGRPTRLLRDRSPAAPGSVERRIDAQDRNCEQSPHLLHH